MMQPTRFALVVNLPSAGMPGLDVRPKRLALADGVDE